MKFNRILITVFFIPGHCLGSAALHAKDDIRLGCAISFSGKYSRSGKLYIDSYRLAVERINRGGGVRVGTKSCPAARNRCWPSGGASDSPLSSGRF